MIFSDADDHVYQPLDGNIIDYVYRFRAFMTYARDTRALTPAPRKISRVRENIDILRALSVKTIARRDDDIETTMRPRAAIMQRKHVFRFLRQRVRATFYLTRFDT